MARVTIEELVSEEFERFLANDYRGRTDAPAFDIITGSVPVLVSAPHAVTHLRDGRVKPSEDFTGSIALAVARASGCHAIVATRTGKGDPNWDALEDSPYKQALCKHVRHENIEIVLDVHGMVAASEALVAIGSADGETAAGGLDERVTSKMAAILGPWCKHFGKPVVLNGRLGARGHNTIARTVARECSVAALQIEIATQLRVPARLGGHAPKGEKTPFTNEQLPIELQARRQADPAAVLELIEALCSIVAMR